MYFPRILWPLAPLRGAPVPSFYLLWLVGLSLLAVRLLLLEQGQPAHVDGEVRKLDFSDTAFLSAAP